MSDLDTPAVLASKIFHTRNNCLNLTIMDRRPSWSCPRVVKIFALLGSRFELVPTERKGRWFVDICCCFLSSIRAGYWCRMCCSCSNAEEYRSLCSSTSLSGTRVSVELSTPVEEMRGRLRIGSKVESWTSSWLLTSPSLSPCWHSLTELFTSLLFTAPFRRNCGTKTSSECCWLCLWAEASGLLSLLLSLRHHYSHVQGYSL